MKSTPNNRRCMLLPVALIILPILALTGCGKRQQQQEMPPPPVSVVTVTEKPVGLYQEYVARTEAVDTVQLRTRVEGFLTRREFTEGQTVEEGQLLFEIDPKPYLASLKMVEADLNSAEAELTRARKDLKRTRELFKKGHVSQSDLDSQTSQEAQAKAGVQVAQANLETAKLNLSYTKITAPISGQIGRANYSVGNLVTPSSDALAILTSVDPIYVTFQINEDQVIDHLQQSAQEGGQLEPDFDMGLRLPNGSSYKYKGTFNFADTHVDEGTGTLSLRAKFPNPEGVIIPGLYTTLFVEDKNKTNHVIIPQASVQENQSGRYVLTVTSDNKVETRPVMLGRRMGPMWVVNSGLASGEKVIVEGVQKVRPGATVNPTVVTVNEETGVIVKPTPSGKQSGQ